jgi:SagB-type dehydrogenase family enzyme
MNTTLHETAREAVLRSLRPLPVDTAVSGPIIPLASDFGRLLCARRSERSFSRTSIEQARIERILVDCAGGVQSSLDANNNIDCLYRTIPQSGGICSIEAYLILLQASGELNVGIYRLCPHSNTLHLVSDVLDTDMLSRAMVVENNPAIDSAAAILVITADFEAKAFKYSTRGHRFALVEVGCALQNALLSICDQGLSGYAYGGFSDEILAEMLKLSFPTVAPIVTILIGSPDNLSAASE